MPHLLPLFHARFAQGMEKQEASLPFSAWKFVKSAAARAAAMQ